MSDRKIPLPIVRSELAFADTPPLSISQFELRLKKQEEIGLAREERCKHLELQTRQAIEIANERVRVAELKMSEAMEQLDVVQQESDRLETKLLSIEDELEKTTEERDQAVGVTLEMGKTVGGQKDLIKDLERGLKEAQRKMSKLKKMENLYEAKKWETIKDTVDVCVGIVLSAGGARILVVYGSALLTGGPWSLPIIGGLGLSLAGLLLILDKCISKEGKKALGGIVDAVVTMKLGVSTPRLGADFHEVEEILRRKRSAHKMQMMPRGQMEFRKSGR